MPPDDSPFDDGTETALAAPVSAMPAPPPPRAITRPSRPPPHDLDAEQAVLGAVLLDGRALPVAKAVVSPADFYHPAHGTIFEAMLSLGAKQTPIDVVTLAAELRRMDRLNTVGGAQYLGELTDVIYTVAHVETHARIVAEHATRRRVIYTGLAMVTKAFGGATIDDLAAFALSEVVKATTMASGRGLRTTMDVVEDAWQIVAASASGSEAYKPVPIGIPAVDTRLEIAGPVVAVIAGRPAMGKSSLAMQYTRATAERGGKVCFFAHEMRPAEVMLRVFAGDLRVNFNDLRAARISQETLVGFDALAGQLASLPIHWNRSFEMTPDEIANEVRREHAMGKVSLVVIDYLQILKLPRGETRERAIADASRSFKQLANELGCPVILLSQLNRGCDSREEKRPVMSDLRESGAIEQDADIIVFVYRDEVYNKDNPEVRGLAEIIIAKQRNGNPDTAHVGFDGPGTRFFSIEGRDEAF